MIESDFAVGFKQGRNEGKQIMLEKIEDIKAEIESKKQYRGISGNLFIYAHDMGLDRYFDKGLDMALSIIDKHISGKEQE